jgi:hypothetical protein
MALQHRDQRDRAAPGQGSKLTAGKPYELRVGGGLESILEVESRDLEIGCRTFPSDLSKLALVQ